MDQNNQYATVQFVAAQAAVAQVLAEGLISKEVAREIIGNFGENVQRLLEGTPVEVKGVEGVTKEKSLMQNDYDFEMARMLITSAQERFSSTLNQKELN